MVDSVEVLESLVLPLVPVLLSTGKYVDFVVLRETLEPLRRSTVYLLLLITAAAVLLSTLFLILARAFTRVIMHITLILSIALNMYVFCLDLALVLRSD